MSSIRASSEYRPSGMSLKPLNGGSGADSRAVRTSALSVGGASAGETGRSTCGGSVPQPAKTDARTNTHGRSCLISDIDLPTIDGFELLQRVNAVRPELTVILITGQPEMARRPPPPGSGHYRLFKKPFDGQELLTAVSGARRAR